MRYFYLRIVFCALAYTSAVPLIAGVFRAGSQISFENSDSVLRVGQKLGEGRYGEVYAVGGRSGNRAVKVFKRVGYGDMYQILVDDLSDIYQRLLGIQKHRLPQWKGSWPLLLLDEAGMVGNIDIDSTERYMGLMTERMARQNLMNISDQFEIKRRDRREIRAVKVAALYNVVVGVLRALELLHTGSRKGPITHGDIKPENIFLRSVGWSGDADAMMRAVADGSLEPILGDYDLVYQKGLQSRLVSQEDVGSIYGTFAYISPEYAVKGGFKTPREDLWSLLASCYFLMTGHHVVEEVYDRVFFGSQVLEKIADLPDKKKGMQRVKEEYSFRLRGLGHMPQARFLLEFFGLLQNEWGPQVYTSIAEVAGLSETSESGIVTSLSRIVKPSKPESLLQRLCSRIPWLL